MNKLTRIISIVIVMCLMATSVSVISQADSLSEDKPISAYDDIFCSGVDEVSGAQVSESGIYQPVIGATARFDNIDFGNGDVKEFVLNYATPDDYAGGMVTVYIDSMDSAPVASIYLNSTEGWSKYLWVPVPIQNSEIVGVHSVYLVWGNKRYSGNFSGFKFTQYSAKDLAGDVPGDIVGTEYEPMYNLLTGVGIIDKTDATSYFLNRKLTAEDLIRLGARLMNVSEEPENLIVLSEQMQIAFDDEANLGALAKLATYILGYKELAEFSTDYETACLSIAHKYDTLDGIQTASDIVTRGGALRFAYNIHDEYVAEVEGIYRDYVSKRATDETVLSYYHGILSKEGIVTGNMYTNLVGAATVREGYVIIGKNKYKTGDTDAVSALGKNIIYYYTDERPVGTLLYVENCDNKIITLDSEDIVSYKNRVLKYYNEEDKVKSLNLDSSFDLIYNHLSKSIYDESLFTDFSGTMTIVDNNSDKKYDVVCIIDTYDIVVDFVSNGIIYEKCGERKIDYKDAQIIIKDQYGQTLKPDVLDELASGNVLTIAESNNSSMLVYDIILAKKNSSGIVDGVYNNEEIVVSGKTYKLSENVKFSTTSEMTPVTSENTVALGDGVTIYLNSRGDVVLVHFSPMPKNYGYIIGVARESGLAAPVQVKIFTEEGQMLIAPCRKVMQIDGETYKNYDDSEALLKSLCGKGTLVIYGLNNDGQVSSIDFPYDLTTGTAVGKNTNEKDNSLHMTHLKTVDTTYSSSAASFNGYAPTSDTSIIFCIPPSGTQEYYLVQKASEVLRSGSYKFKAYSTDVSKLSCDVYVLDQFADDAEFFKKVNSIGESSGDIICYLVKISSVYDKVKEQAVTGLTYYNKGVLHTVMAEDAVMATAPGVSVGDAVRIKTIDGYAHNIEHIFDLSASATDPGNCIMSGGSTSYTSAIGARYGTVEVKSGTYFKFNEYEEIYNAATANIYVYEDRGVGCPIKIGTINDIIDSNLTPGGDRLVLTSYAGKAVSILVIK